MEYLISVIIPVYNNKDTLPETLDCILRQSVYNEAQIICVDDGSSDGSAEILKKYSQEHNNISVITKENGGVSSARNEGLRHAQGKYLVFLDADDLISGDDALENLCGEMEKTGADAGVFRLMTFGFGGKEFNPLAEKLAKKESVSCFDTDLLWNFPVSNKIYKTSLVKNNGILFPYTVYTEDGAFWMTFVMRLQPKIIGIYGAVSMYRQSDPRQHTQATQNIEIRSLTDFIRSCEIISNEINNSAVKDTLPCVTKENFIREFNLRVCHILINGFYRKILRADNEFIDCLKEKYSEYFSLLSDEDKKRLVYPDLPEICFSKTAIAEKPLVSIKVDNPSDRFISSVLLQTTPYFEICTAAETDAVNANHGKPKSAIVIKAGNNEEPDPRLVSGIIKIRDRFPFIPSFLLKPLAETYLKSKG